MLFELLVEFWGTFFYLFIIFTTLNPVYIGLTLGILVAVFSNTSGVNFNPAVTIASFYGGSLKKDFVIPYIISQIAGGLFAVFVAKHFNLFK